MGWGLFDEGDVVRGYCALVNENENVKKIGKGLKSIKKISLTCFVVSLTTSVSLAIKQKTWIDMLF